MAKLPVKPRPPATPPPAIRPLQYRNAERDIQIAREVARRWRRLRIKHIINVTGNVITLILILFLIAAWRLKFTFLRFLFGSR